MKFKKRRNSELILRKIREIRTVEKTHATIKQSNTDWLDVLASAIETPRNENTLHFDRAVRSALYSADLPTDFNQKKLFSEISKKLSLEKSKPKKTFYFYFSLTGLRTPVFIRAKNREAHANFAPKPSTKFFRTILRERDTLRSSELKRSASNDYQIPPIDKELAVLVKTSSSRHIDAYRHASNLIDFERGLLNFLNNRYLLWRHSSPPSPVNAILERPFTTVHEPSGELASDTFWYQENWSIKSISNIPSARLDRIAQQYSKMKKIHQRNRLSSWNVSLVRQYCRVFDTSDYRDSFLRAWTLLEKLTLASGDYERLVKRASKVWKEEETFRELAQHLREKRNDFVHSEASSEHGGEELIYLSKQLIEPLLRIYLVNDFKFSQPEELVDFLDLPSSRSELMKQKEMIDKGLKFRS